MCHINPLVIILTRFAMRDMGRKREEERRIGQE